MKLIAIVFSFFAIHANAVQFEIGAGQALAQKAEDGIYYQERFPHTLDLQGEVYTIGVTDKTKIFGHPTRWRVFGVIMHGLGGNSDAVQDEQYSPRSATGCVDAGCGLFSRYESNLSTRGIAATIAPEFNAFSLFGKAVIVSPEIGVHVYFPRMDEDVYTLDGNSPASSHRYYHYKWGMNAGEVFGVGVEWGNVRVSLRRYKINMVNRTTDTGPDAWRTDIPSPVGELINTVSIDWRF